MKSYRWLSIILIISVFVFSGCTKEEMARNNSQDSEQEIKIDSPSFGEDKRLYNDDRKNSIVTFYMTISDTNGTSFYELNNWYSIHDSSSKSPKLDIIIQEGTETGAFAFDETDVNASIELRGKSTRIAAQKSYKIKLYDRAGLWKGQKTLNLNKHPYDGTRVRNKLSFDYFTLIPHTTSMRTQFVHLYVKDLTNKQSNGQFIDYGLYTHVEQANERFLATHGLDSNGNLYKASNFEFFRYPDQLKLENDPGFDKAAFESILENKGSKDHHKLIAMLEDINNYALNMDEVMERHFDKENYFTWIAANILMGNHDIMTQNFYLYSPLNSEKWYFIPWDYDGAWQSSSTKEVRSEIPDWQLGLSNFWGSVLHKRVFKNPQNVEALTKKIEELTTIINPEQTKKLLDEYYPMVSEMVKKSPDKDFLDINISDYHDVYYGMVHASEINKEMYMKNLEKPMPFFLNEYSVSKDEMGFEWDPSFDIQGDEISYTWQISEDPAFTKIIDDRKELIETKLVVKRLKTGIYYWRVIAQDSHGHKQGAFDIYEDEDGEKFFGVRKVIINN